MDQLHAQQQPIYGRKPDVFVTGFTLPGAGILQLCKLDPRTQVDVIENL